MNWFHEFSYGIRIHINIVAPSLPFIRFISVKQVLVLYVQLMNIRHYESQWVVL